MLIESTVERIEILNKEYFDSKKERYRFKTVFYCKSSTGEPRMCVCWDRTTMSVGDRVQMKGRISDGVFLAWSVMILKRASELNEVAKGEKDVS